LDSYDGMGGYDYRDRDDTDDRDNRDDRDVGDTSFERTKQYLKDSYSLAAPVSISNSSNSNSHISGKRMT
jgi:hypothetical protein